MDIILLERIEKLGQMGDVVHVKPGYARNYLLPQKKALRATKANMAYFESKRVELEAVNLKRRQEAESVAGTMGAVRLVLIRQASEGGQLYGSVTARDLQDGLKEQGIKVERRQVLLDQPIKTLGSSEVRLQLHAEVVVTITVVIARSLEEAEQASVAPVEEPEEAEYDVEEEEANEDSEEA